MKPMRFKYNRGEGIKNRILSIVLCLVTVYTCLFCGFEAFAKTKEAGEAFLEANKKREGVTTLASGLQYEVINVGLGKKPAATDKVQCHYEGTLIDGTIFDSSIKRGEPAVFGVNQVIRGWVEALQLMQEGAKWRLYIPYDMAYGEHGAGEMIPPYSALVFDVELIKVL